MKPTALAFSGGIASGKTAVSSAVAAELAWPRMAFGDYVEQVAGELNLAQTRDVLQELGAALIDEQGWEDFCRSALARTEWQPGESIVIDGVRHREVVETLRKLVAPSRLLLVLITTPMDVRRQRLVSRGEEGSDLTRAEAHSTEVQVVDRLPALADFKVDGSRPAEQVTLDVLSWLGRQ